jgi:ABC-type glycerol-3-phosphate transport system substrate-binding protein
VDTLRAQYPGVTIYSIPYGAAALKLRTLFEAGNLPDVTNLQGPSESSLFTDNKGHGGQILKDLGELIWMDAIYGVDLDKYAYDSGYETDLKAIAKSIMDAHDPNYNGPNR